MKDFESVQGLKEAMCSFSSPTILLLLLLLLFVLFFLFLALRTIISGDLWFAVWLSYPSPVVFCVTAQQQEDCCMCHITIILVELLCTNYIRCLEIRIKVGIIILLESVQHVFRSLLLYPPLPTFLCLLPFFSLSIPMLLQFV